MSTSPRSGEALRRSGAWDSPTDPAAPPEAPPVPPRGFLAAAAKALCQTVVSLLTPAAILCVGLHLGLQMGQVKLSLDNLGRRVDEGATCVAKGAVAAGALTQLGAASSLRRLIFGGLP
jgi:hypothetical protein